MLSTSYVQSERHAAESRETRPMAIKLCFTTLAVVALHTLVWCAPVFAAEAPAPAPTVTMPAVVIKPCVARPLVQGSGSVRVCKGGVL